MPSITFPDIILYVPILYVLYALFSVENTLNKAHWQTKPLSLGTYLRWIFCEITVVMIPMDFLGLAAYLLLQLLFKRFSGTLSM